MAVLESLQFVPFGPYRFIGKSVYARAGSNHSGFIFGSLWQYSKPVFDTLDRLNAHATAETDNAALLTSDKYDEEKQLLGYTVGRFMQAGMPVPEGLDYFDIPAMYVAKGLVSGEFDDMIVSADKLIMAAISRQTEYAATWAVAAEIYKKATVPESGVSSIYGYYIGCKKAGAE